MIRTCDTHGVVERELYIGPFCAACENSVSSENCRVIEIVM